MINYDQCQGHHWSHWPHSNPDWQAKSTASLPMELATKEARWYSISLFIQFIFFVTVDFTVLIIKFIFPWSRSDNRSNHRYHQRINDHGKSASKITPSPLSLWLKLWSWPSSLSSSPSPLSSSLSIGWPPSWLPPSTLSSWVSALRLGWLESSSAWPGRDGHDGHAWWSWWPSSSW